MNKLPVPEGWFEVRPPDTIKAGDKWCLDGDDEWLPTAWAGYPVAEGTLVTIHYIRKFSVAAPVSVSLSVPQDSPSTS